MFHKKSVAGAILAGGKNSRMRGERKALLTYGEKAFWEHAAAALKAVDRLYLSVDRCCNWDSVSRQLRKADVIMVEDAHPEAGPLGGIASVLAAMEEDALLVVPCDIPLLNEELTGMLLRDYRQHQKPVFLEQSHGHPHPLVGVYPRDCLPLALGLLRDGQFKARALTTQLHPRLLPVRESKEVLQNINCPDDYRALLNR